MEIKERESNEEDYKLDHEISSVSCDTLKDEFPELPLTDDITVRCGFCQQYFHYREIKYHRNIHNCLTFFQINSLKLLSFKSLSKRRAKIKRYIETLPLKMQSDLILKLESSYSILYNYLIEESHQDVCYSSLSKEIQPPHIYKNISNKYGQTFTELLEDGFENWFQVTFGYTNLSGHGKPSLVRGKVTENDLFLGLLTGNDGDCAQKFVCCHILEYLSTKMDSISNEDSEYYLKKLNEALINSMKKLDKDLSTGLHDQVTFNRWSSCCLETVTISNLPGKYMISTMNIGEGLIILVNKDSHSVISSNHSMKNNEEEKRIRESGGTISVIDDNRFLHGITDKTQVIGGYGSSKLKMFQLPEPNVVNVEIDLKTSLGLIVVNSTIGKLITVQDAVDIFRTEIFDSKYLENFVDYEDLKDLVDSPSTLSSRSSTVTEIGDKQLGELLQSGTIVRKIVNAARLNSIYETNLGALVFVFDRLKS